MHATIVDMAAYPRRAHFDYFRRMANPYVGLTAEVDVTRVVVGARARGASFFLCLLHLAGCAANGVREFRQRIRAEQIVEYDICRTSHTVARGDGTYVYCVCDPSLPLDAFLTDAARRQREAAGAGDLREDDEAEELLFVSCLPWMPYTSLVQPTPAPADSNPRITWGRYFAREGRLLLPLTVLVNHALVDGRQICAFYEGLRAQIEAFSP